MTDKGIKSTLSKFADVTELSGAVATPEAIQRDPHILEKWAHGNITRFDKAKPKVLHQGQGNPQDQYGLGHEKIESSRAENRYRDLVDERLDMSQKCLLALQKVKHVPGCIKGNVTSPLRERSFPSTLLS